MVDSSERKMWYKNIIRHRLMNRDNWSLFSKLFTALICVSILPVIASSLLMYTISRQNLETEVSRSNLETLKQTQLAIDNALDDTERISLQLVRNKEVQNFLNRRITKPSPSDPTVTSAMNVADSFLEGMQYIESISIYSFLSNVMVSSGAQRYAEMDINFIENYGNSLKNKGFTIWIEPDDTGIFGETSRSVQFVEFIFETFNKPQGIILIKLKSEEFAKSINDMYIRKSGYIFVINDKGNIILGKNKNSETFNPQEFIVKYRGISEGYYRTDTGKEPMLVSFTTSRYNQWKYIAMVPTSEIEDRAGLIGKVTFAACLLFIAIAVLLSFQTSRGIYGPIAAIDSLLRGIKPDKSELELLKTRKDELGRIQQELDDKIVKLKKYFLYRLTYGGITDPAEIQNQANFLEIPVHQQFVTVILEHDKSAREVLDFAQSDALKSQMLMIIQDALSETLNLVTAFYEYRNDSDRIVAVIFLPSEQPTAILWPMLKSSIKTAQEKVMQQQGSTITAAVGSVQERLENIRISYYHADEALKHKFIKGSNAIILQGEPDPEDQTGLSKHDLTGQLLNCLQAHNFDQAEKILDGFKRNMKGKNASKAAYIFYCKDLINEMIEYVEGLGTRFAEEKNELTAMFDAFEKRYDDINHAITSISDITRRIIEKLEQDNPELSRRRSVAKAVEIIGVKFGKDISLSSICDRIGISEPYFSKIFKEELGKNFKDYLTSVKIAKAKAMLISSNDPINQIAGRVGYNNHN